MNTTRQLAAIALALGISAPGAGAVTIESGVAGLKLIMLDKYGLGKAKLVYVAKGDAGIQKGPGGDPPGLSGMVEVFALSDPGNKAVYDLPADWLVNKDAVAKYVNKSAAPGSLGAKVVALKPGLVAKVVAKNLGDDDAASGDDGASDLDLQALTDTAETIRVVVTVNNASDGNTYVFCSDFDGLAIKLDGSNQPFKLLSKTSTAPASCGISAPSTTTPTTSTTTTTLVAVGCCQLASACRTYHDLAGSEPIVCQLSGGAWNPATLCDATGSCVPPNGTPGNCCQGLSCDMPVDPGSCLVAGATAFSDAVCNGGVCVGGTPVFPSTTITTTTTSTTTTLLALGCCQGSSCLTFDVGGLEEALCEGFGVATWYPDTLCDATGSCVAPNGTPGDCCETGSNVCDMSTGLASCLASGGAAFSNAVCNGGSCVGGTPVTTTSTTTTTTTSTTTTTLPYTCSINGARQCGGTCPPGFVCFDSGVGCGCVSTSVSCSVCDESCGDGDVGFCIVSPFSGQCQLCAF